MGCVHEDISPSHTRSKTAAGSPCVTKAYLISFFFFKGTFKVIWLRLASQFVSGFRHSICIPTLRLPVICREFFQSCEACFTGCTDPSATGQMLRGQKLRSSALTNQQRLLTKPLPPWNLLRFKIRTTKPTRHTVSERKATKCYIKGGFLVTVGTNCFHIWYLRELGGTKDSQCQNNLWQLIYIIMNHNSPTYCEATSHESGWNQMLALLGWPKIHLYPLHSDCQLLRSSSRHLHHRLTVLALSNFLPKQRNMLMTSEWFIMQLLCIHVL